MNQIVIKRRMSHYRRRRRFACQLLYRKRPIHRSDKMPSHRYRTRQAALNGKSSEDSVVYVGTCYRTIVHPAIDLTQSSTSLVKTKTKRRKEKNSERKRKRLRQTKTNESNEDAVIMTGKCSDPCLGSKTTLMKDHVGDDDTLGILSQQYRCVSQIPSVSDL
jgi:hypothetical protein